MWTQSRRLLLARSSWLVDWRTRTVMLEAIDKSITKIRENCQWNGIGFFSQLAPVQLRNEKREGEKYLNRTHFWDYPCAWMQMAEMQDSCELIWFDLTSYFVRQNHKGFCIELASFIWRRFALGARQTRERAHNNNQFLIKRFCAKKRVRSSRQIIQKRRFCTHSLTGSIGSLF